MLQHVLLESRLLLFGAWMALQLVVIGVWSWRRTRAANRAVWAGLIALPLLMLVSTLVETGREQLIATCRSLARNVERGEVWAIKSRLAPGFEAAQLDRAAFGERLEPALQRYAVGNVRLSRFGFAFDADDRATVALSASCNVRTADRFMNRVLTRWRVRFIRAGDEWLITSLEAVPTPFSPVRHLRDWIR